MIMLRILTLVCAVIVVIVLGALPAAARADTDRADGYGIGFLGGMLLPLGATGDTHERALAAGLRMGYTGRSGLGLDLAIEYSPLPLRAADAAGVSETQFATAGLMPRFTLGKRRLRGWLGAGGGLALQYDTLTDGSTQMLYEPAGMGAVALELHVLTGVGLVAMGSYTRTFGDLAYEYITATGGLLLTFR
jgi:hypothetical protein